MSRPSGKHVKAVARVRLEVEISVPASWGDDCQVSQIHMQAAESARRFLATLPAGQFPAGEYVATATVIDTNGQSVTKTKTLTTGGPTITAPYKPLRGFVTISPPSHTSDVVSLLSGCA